MKKFLQKFSAVGLLLALTVHSAYAGTLEDALAIGRNMKLPEITHYTPKLFHDTLESMFGENFTTILTPENENISAKNTELLDGKSGENFLKKSYVNCNGGQVAMGVSEDGKIRCASKEPLQLVKATIRSGSVTMQSKTATKTMKAGDILEISDPITLETAEPKANEGVEKYRAEITFEDGSLIRMDKGTKIELRGVAREANGRVRTIAQASYAGRGLLWGRVLSDDGPEFRHNQIIAGVRGTSIALQANKIHIFQSQNHENAALLSVLQGNGGLKSIENMARCSSVSVVWTKITKGRTNGKNILDPYCFENTDKNLQEIVADFTAKDREYVATMPDNPENKIIWPKKMEIRRVAPNSDKFVLYIDGVGEVWGGWQEITGGKDKGAYKITFNLSDYPKKRVLQNMPKEAFQSIFQQYNINMGIHIDGNGEGNVQGIGVPGYNVQLNNGKLSLSHNSAADNENFVITVKDPNKIPQSVIWIK